MARLSRLFLLAFLGMPALALAQAPPPSTAFWNPDDAWQAVLTPEDAERFANLPATRAAALVEATAAPDLAQVAALIDMPTVYGEVDAILGDWECRTIKIGGLLPLTIYGYFACTIGRDEMGFFIEKSAGSQRFTGRLYFGETPGEFVYVGAGHYADEQPRGYGDDPERNQVGVLRRLDANHLLLELPKPIFESNHDWIELVR